MKIYTFLFFYFICFFIFGQEFIQVQGKKTVLNNQEFNLKSIFFENDSRFLQNHFLYSKSDFQEVKKLNFNCIELELIGRSFEEKQIQNQVEWLKKQIQWAKEENIYLIFTLEKTNENYWQKIIQEFKNESQILAFNLKNASPDFIKNLRTLDNHHIFIIEKQEILVDDKNIIYSVDFFEPIAFTHQEKKWDNLKNNQKYPHNEKLEFPTDLQFVRIDTNNRKFGTGKSEWTYYEGYLNLLGDSLIGDSTFIGSPILTSSKSPVGSIYFNEFVVEEVDLNGKSKEILRIHAYNSANWKWTSQDGKGSFKQVRSQDMDNNDVLVIQQTEELGYCYNYDFRFPIKKQHLYKISGWVKGADVSFEGENCFGFLVEKSTKNLPILHRNKTYIEFYLKDFLAFQEKNDVPLYFKIGTKNNTFKQKRGGDNWLNDVKTIISPNGFCYYNYLSKDFGIYSMSKKGKKVNELVEAYFKKN